MATERVFETTLCALLTGALLICSCSKAPSGAKSGSGGTTGTGGVASGTGGVANGGANGSGGALASGGVKGLGGALASGGASGLGGAPGSGGTSGESMAGAGGGPAGTGGVAAGTGGAGGQPACPSLPSAPAADGSIVQFNDNGGWNWFQDERAVVDTKANKLIIGTTASGGTRDGQTEAVIYDLATNSGIRYTLPSSLLSSNVDDHNSPALLIRPDGKYLAIWSSHRLDCYSRYSIFDGTQWSAEQEVDWAAFGCPWPGADTNKVTYSNPWYVGTDIFNMVRSVDTLPGVLRLADDGQTWSYYGKLTTPFPDDVGGYYKYWGDNLNRIDFIGTEANPRDFDNNLWAGYVQDGKVYDSLGTVVDSSLQDPSPTTSNARPLGMFSPVFTAESTIHGLQLGHAWSHDLVRYADGTVAVLMQARVTGTGTTDPDKRALYARFDGSAWKVTYLVKLGPRLFPDEEDFTGLSALDPDDPHVIYVSTVYDPRDDTTMTPRHEIYQGITCDDGATWNWAPITQGSTTDNIRPIVPKWDASHRALLWLRGTYTSAQYYDMSVVGLVGNRSP